MENGKRLNTLLKENIIYYNDEEKSIEEKFLVDADLFGGQPPEYYLNGSGGGTGSVDTSNFVKKSGDTMTGHLQMTNAKELKFVTEEAGSGAEFRLFKQNNSDVFCFTLNNDGAWTKNLLRINPDGSILENNLTGVELLWTNASPTSNFAEQTLSLSTIKTAENVLIRFAAMPTNFSTHYIEVLAKRTDNQHCYDVFKTRYDNGHYTVCRAVTFDWNNGTIKFSNGSQNGNSGSNYIIPLDIIKLS